MIIKYIKGDLLESDEGIIAHSGNIKGGFGSGVAGAIAKKYPEAREDYLAQYGRLTLGDNIYSYVDDMERLIIHMLCQPSYGYDGKKYVSYDAIDTSIKKLNGAAEIGNWRSIAFPLIGTKLGGGKWSIISTIIETNAKFFQPIVYSLDGVIPE